MKLIRSLIVSTPVSSRKYLEVGMLQDIPCRTASVVHPWRRLTICLPMGLRAPYDFSGWRFCARWRESIRTGSDAQSFCPSCGTKTVIQTAISNKCPACKYEIYPAVSAAILVLIRKRFDSFSTCRIQGIFHGLVAGFLETGETLEGVCRREVMEETGLEISNITI